MQSSVRGAFTSTGWGSRKARSDGLSWMLTTLPPRLAARAFHSSSLIIVLRSSFFDDELVSAVLIKLTCFYSIKTYLTLAELAEYAGALPPGLSDRPHPSRMREPQKVHGKLRRPISSRRTALAYHPSCERTSMRRSLHLQRNGDFARPQITSSLDPLLSSAASGRE